MRVFNLTDVSTPTLRSNGLVNTRVTVSGVTIAPGGSEIVNRIQTVDQRLFYLGAVSYIQPLSYLRAKSTAASAAAPTQEPAVQDSSTTPTVPPPAPLPSEGDEHGGKRKKKRNRDWQY